MRHSLSHIISTMWVISFVMYWIYYMAVVNAYCRSLPNIEYTTNNITTPGPYPNGTVVRFFCGDDYIQQGNSLYLCSESTWLYGSMTCELITCKHVEPPENGFLSNEPSYEVGTFLVFECNQGYDTIGATRLLCRGDGFWNPSYAPVCKIKTCGAFGDVLNGDTFQDNTFHERDAYGAVVDVTCDRGYVLEGSKEVVCGENGWGDKPVCKPSTCDPYPGFNSSCIGNQRLTDTGFLFIVCRTDTSSTRTGPNYVKCKDHRWEPAPSDNLLACYCNCKVNISSNMVISNIDADGYLKHEETLDWRCKHCSVKESSEPLICRDGKMSSLPKCISKQPPVTYGPDYTGSTQVHRTSTSAPASSPKPPSTITSSPKTSSTITSSPNRPSTITSSPKPSSIITSSPKPPSTITSSPKTSSSITSSPNRPSTITSSPKPPSIVTSSPKPPSTITSIPVFYPTQTSVPEPQQFPYWIPIVAVITVIFIIVVICFYLWKKGHKFTNCIKKSNDNNLECKVVILKSYRFVSSPKEDRTVANINDKNIS